MTTWKMFDARDYEPNIVVSVNEGRIVFGKKAYRRLWLETHRSIKFAREEDTGTLYMAICVKDSEDAFPIKEENDGGYVNVRNLLDYLEIDYKNKRVHFELSRVTHYDDLLKGTTYKITIITNNRKKKK